MSKKFSFKLFIQEELIAAKSFITPFNTTPQKIEQAFKHWASQFIEIENCNFRMTNGNFIGWTN